MHGTTDGVKVLLAAGANKEARTADGATPAFAAARYGKLDALRALLDGGADPNAEHNSTGATPIHSAAWEGHYPVVELLLSKGANVNEVNDVRCHP